MRRVSILTGVALLLVSAAAYAGPQLGPFSGTKTINPRTTTTWTINCQAGQDTVFTSKGDGGTDMDVLVLDSQGFVLVDPYGGPGDKCRATWFSAKNEKVFVLLINRGNVANTATYSAR